MFPLKLPLRLKFFGDHFVVLDLGQADYFALGILKKAILGEREGFEYLVSTYQNLAYTVALKICGNSEDAEEVRSV